MRQKLRTFIENRTVERLIMILIVLNLLVYVLDTVQGFHNLFNNGIHRFEIFSIAIFTVEYICRVVTLEKAKDIFKPMLVIDLLAILPFYLSFCTLNAVFLRVFRLSRLLRIMKIGRYSNALENIVKGLKEKKEELIITFSIFFVAVLVASILMYIVENPAQPQVFSSIPKSFYFTIITFTSVGYGDIHPITNIGKVLTSILAVLGIGFHGLFIGIFSVALMSAFKKDKE